MQNGHRLNNILLNAIVDGCTGAAFFKRLTWLGAPKQLLDTRTVEHYLGSEDRRADERVTTSISCHRKLGSPQTVQELHSSNVAS